MIVQMEIVKFCIVDSGGIIRFICFSLSTFYCDANVLLCSCVIFLFTCREHKVNALLFRPWQLKKKYGYTRLDATDASQAMLDKARDTGVYRNFYCCRIGGGYKLPMADSEWN